MSKCTVVVVDDPIACLEKSRFAFEGDSVIASRAFEAIALA
jgi:hypothetical protein